MKSTRKFYKIRITAVMLILTAFFGWRTNSFAQKSEELLKATANFQTDEAIAPDAAIEISLSRALQSSEKIAVTIGQMDVSGLFSRMENRFVYDANFLPLPVGNSNLTVYLIEPNGSWNEIARLLLLVRSPESKVQNLKIKENKVETQTEKQSEEQSKTEEKKEVKIEDANNSENKTVETKTEETNTETKTETTEKKRFFKFLPTFTIAMQAQPFQSNFPAEARPEKRAVFNDFDLTGSLKTEGKIGILTGESSFDFAGSTFKEKTLQFGALGEDAPDVDLSSYLMNLQIGKAKFSLGHTSFGSNRHLVSGFSSRGLSVNIPINRRFDVTAGVLNGTSVLGFGNFFGVSKVRHQVQGATLGIEFFPKRPLALRLEITGFNAYLQALNSVSESRVVDAERSRGFGLRFVTSDKSERFKLEFGYALSRFFNPQDSTLDPDGNAVSLPAALRSAHYAEASYHILKDLKLTETKKLNLTFGFKYEFVEPLYKSLGASPAADKFSQEYALDGSISEISFTAARLRSNDNLRNVASILKSLTRAERFSVTLPLSALIGKSENPSPFLPRFAYSIDRTRNFGAGIPVNGGFEIDPATIPDLVNTNQTFSSAWQFKKLTLEYTYNRSYADNRQTEVEKNDQLGWVHGLTVGVNPLKILSFNVGLTLDSQRNFELEQVNQTKTLNFGGNWQPFKNATLTIDFSQTLAGDAARTNRNRNINYNAQFAYNFNLEKSKFKKFGTQLFVRFADTLARNQDFINDLNNRTQTKLITGGMTFNFF
ncbi:MAG: hypothetical protein LH614_05430 [Pyrinomonadaceae bacterium]|nr:hypothetical protein [Pyrinomonadaceae bacterium]